MGGAVEIDMRASQPHFILVGVRYDGFHADREMILGWVYFHQESITALPNPIQRSRCKYTLEGDIH